MIYKQEYYENIAENIIGKFNTRGIEGYYCTDREEANAKAKRFLTPGCTISWEPSLELHGTGRTGAKCAHSGAVRLSLQLPGYDWRRADQ